MQRPTSKRGLRALHQPTLALHLTLCARVVWNAGFCVILVGMGAPTSFPAILRTFGGFALVDGVLALVTALGYLALSPQRLLWLSPAADGVTRLILATLVHHGPGIPVLPLLVVLYLGVAATFILVDGVLDLAEGISLQRELGSRGGGVALAVAGGAASVLGVVLFVRDPEAVLLRNVLLTLGATHVAALASGIRNVAGLLAADTPPRFARWWRRVLAPG